MTDTPNTDNAAPEQPQSESPASSQTENSDHMIPRTRFNEVNEQRKEALAKLEAYEKNERERREKELAEQNKYKELYEEAQQKLSQLGTVQEQATRYQKAVQATNEARLARIPDERRSLVPDYDDPVKLGAWLDENEALLTTPGKPTPPPADGSAGGGGSSSDAPGLPPGVQQAADIARQLGYSVNTDRVAELSRRNQQPTDNQE